MPDLTLLGFADLITRKVGELAAEQWVMLDEAAQTVETEAKRVIGTYDYGWPQLAQSTQNERASKGFSPNEPLLRTGEMRASIQHNTDLHEAHIGSNSDKAVWQELGTVRIPPRSFLVQALVHKAPSIVQRMGDRVVGTLSGQHAIGPRKP